MYMRTGKLNKPRLDTRWHDKFKASEAHFLTFVIQTYTNEHIKLISPPRVSPLTGIHPPGLEPDKLCGQQQLEGRCHSLSSIRF